MRPGLRLPWGVYIVFWLQSSILVLSMLLSASFVGRGVL